MQNKSPIGETIGWIVFISGAVYMLGLGWAYSWKMVPAANQAGPDALAGFFGFMWALAVPLGAFIVAIGAALVAKVERGTFWFLILIVLLFTVWRILGTTSQMVPALFGIGGGLIMFFFLGSVWDWIKARPSLSSTGQSGSDLRMLGLTFFVVAAWDLCGIFGISNFVLRPELAQKFSVSHGSTINAASTVLLLLALGWGFNYLGGNISRKSE